MDNQTLFDYQWPFLLSFLPDSSELESSARELGAIRRKRCVTSASDLLRLALVYGFCGLSLRQTAAWAETAGVASLSDVALLKRLRCASSWLGQILGCKLAERSASALKPHDSIRLRIVDATTISRPGSTGTDWRVHLGFDLTTFAIDHVEVTDVKGGETLRRFAGRPGDVIVGDQGYSHCKGMASVLSSGGDFLIRMNWQNVPLQRSDGMDFDLFDELRRIPDGRAVEFPVLVAPQGKGRIRPFPVRLVAVRKTEPAAEKARHKALKERSRKSRSTDPRTLEAAGYLLVLTSLPASTLSAAEVLEVYRFRWQIELAFKRMKSLLHLDQLPAKDPDLAKSFIFAKLLAALLIEDLTERYLSFSPWGFRLDDTTSISVEDSANTR
jgi:hypothetical protein